MDVKMPANRAVSLPRAEGQSAPVASPAGIGRGEGAANQAIRQVSVQGGPAAPVAGTQRAPSEPARMLDAYAALGKPGRQHAARAGESGSVPAREVSGAHAATSPSDESQGHQMMLERLFGGNEPEVGNGAEGLSVGNFHRNPMVFLTRADRQLMADVYDMAASNGIDLQYVDSLAYDLGSYRQGNNGRSYGNFNDFQNYDENGYRQTVHFRDEDAVVASRILEGGAMSSTRLDSGFLTYRLDPGTGALSSMGDMKFLEYVVNHFSASADTNKPSSEQFQRHVGVTDRKDRVVFKTHAERAPESEAVAGKVNGVWVITDKGRQAGITMDMLV